MLPIRLDDSDLPGVPAVIAFMDLRHKSMDEIGAALKRILGAPRTRPPAEKQLVKRRPENVIVRLHPQNFLGIVVQKDNEEAPKHGDLCSPNACSGLHCSACCDEHHGKQFAERVIIPAKARRRVLYWCSEKAVITLSCSKRKQRGLSLFLCGTGPALEARYSP